jgi:hypothetical protein
VARCFIEKLVGCESVCERDSELGKYATYKAGVMFAVAITFRQDCRRTFDRLLIGWLNSVLDVFL